jgi:YbbR domain-containing protein
VSAKRSVQDYLSEDNFKAVVDLEDYDEQTGLVPIRVECNKYSGQIESMKSKSEYASVNIEEMLRKQFVITPVVTGDPEEGYVVGTVSTAENIVRISGAQSAVAEIKRVTAEVSVTGLSSDVNTSVDLKLYDKNDKQITDTNLIKNISTVAMSVQILATKELPLRFSTSGVPKEGYGISGEVKANKETVVIAGKATSLSYLNSVDITSAAIKVDGADKDLEIEVDLTRYLPEGITLADMENDRIVSVYVPIEEVATRDFEMHTNAVKMQGLPEGFASEIIDSDDTITIRVEGFASQINAMKVNNVKLSVDWKAYMSANSMDKIKEGRYRVPLAVEVPDGITKSAGEITVLVELTEK